MSQQVKDVYSGIKKIFPSARRSESFSLSSRFNAVESAPTAPRSGQKKTRPSSFTFTSWKEKHRTSSEPTPSVVMSLPYGATAATPKGKKAPHDVHRLSLSQTLSHAFHASPLFHSHTPNATVASPSSNDDKTVLSYVTPPQLGRRSVSAEVTTLSSLDTRPLRDRSVRHGLNTLQGSPKPITNHVNRDTIHPRASPSPRTSRNQLVASESSVQGVIASPLASTNVRKPRRLSMSFSSSMRRQREQSHAFESLEVSSVTRLQSPDSDEFDASSRPTRGFNRRAQSLDAMEHTPTHVISKWWRKLPLQARFRSGRGGIDLDLEKDRVSFSRSSEARKLAQAADKAKMAELRRRATSHGVPGVTLDQPEELWSPGYAKRTRFRRHPTIVRLNANDGTAGAYTGLESYDDVLVRVCRFAAHDHRRTTIKVHEFLERSLLSLSPTRMKHGQVVHLSNEEIRRWRRLAQHDWAVEDVTTVAAARALGVCGKDVEAPNSRSSSIETDSTDSDSDGHSLHESAVEDEPEEEHEDEVLEVPSGIAFDRLCAVVNVCVNFGDVLFTPEDICHLVHLQFLVEEDGWI